MRAKLTILTFIITLQGSLFAQLPACQDSFPSSLLLNSSFEQYSGCPNDTSGLEGGYIDGLPGYGRVEVDNWHSFTGQNHEAHYFNYNCRLNQPESIFNPSYSECYPYPQVPLPLPDGTGFISIRENDVEPFSEENKIFKTYITTCLSQTLKAGETYILSFSFGFARQSRLVCFQRSPSPYGVAIFGRQDCPSYPLNNSGLEQGCLANNAGWVQLGRITLKGYNEWVTAAIDFTPQTDISSLGIGPDCTNRNHDSLYFYGEGEMYYMDKFVLASKADFSFRAITAISGNVCSGHFVLKAPDYTGAFYQWYKDSILIPGATSEIYTVPDKKEAAGNYVVNIMQPSNICLNSLPFSVAFSELPDFSLGDDTLLCTPASITLNAGLRTVNNYLWQNGSNEPTLNVDKSGLYWVQLTDNNGCTKEDSINITVQGCDECNFYVPSAFTPNDDGLNDVFRVKPKCPNIGLQNFILRIYNRWGQLVFVTKDMNKGWNGMYKNKKLDSGVYIYVVDYSFKQKQILQQKGTIMLLK